MLFLKKGGIYTSKLGLYFYINLFNNKEEYTMKEIKDIIRETNVLHVFLFLLFIVTFLGYPVEIIIKASLALIVFVEIARVASESGTIESLQSFFFQKTIKLSDEEKERVACHEIGHAILCRWANLEIESVSINSAGDILGQVVHFNYKYMTKNDYINLIKVLLAGMLAEEITYGCYYNWCTDDFRKAKLLTIEMLDSGYGNKLIYDETEINEECEKILRDAKQEVEKILIKNNSILKQLSGELLRKKEMSGTDLKLRFACFPEVK